MSQSDFTSGDIAKSSPSFCHWQVHRSIVRGKYDFCHTLIVFGGGFHGAVKKFLLPGPKLQNKCKIEQYDRLFT
jgi:hypothetical protein